MPVTLFSAPSNTCSTAVIQSLLPLWTKFIQVLPHFHTFFLADLQVENDLRLDPSPILLKMPHEDKSKKTNGEDVYLHFHGKHVKCQMDGAE